jgi:lipopolysaccharide transport system ATP-binding protein
MSDTVIKVENLGKKYLIRHQQSERYTALRDVLTNKFKSFGKIIISLQPPSSNLQPSREEFWALQDVSFEVKQGARIGIIGRNGAGKTTLLKLLSRITEPTAGRIAIKGRVASLLEVGTGFHPELTGRENIFLNGAILGMSKLEIKRKFDEIVDFAEVEKFLDTPVKRYSSGMFVRLAFAVAAHLEPEILLVDEVLAVGDAQFQKKCLGKMGEVAKQGRTVLFVSHNMGAVLSLCSVTLWIDKGRLHSFGNSEITIHEYIASDGKQNVNLPFSDKPRRFRCDDVMMSNFELLNKEGQESIYHVAGEPLRFRFFFKANCSFSNLSLEFYIVGENGNRIVYGGSNPLQDFTISAKKGEEICIECLIPHLWLAAGYYFIDAIISIPNTATLEYVENAGEFNVVFCNPFGGAYNVTNQVAPVVLPHYWSRIC